MEAYSCPGKSSLSQDVCLELVNGGPREIPVHQKTGLICQQILATNGMVLSDFLAKEANSAESLPLNVRCLCQNLGTHQACESRSFFQLFFHLPLKELFSQQVKQKPTLSGYHPSQHVIFLSLGLTRPCYETSLNSIYSNCRCHLGRLR